MTDRRQFLTAAGTGLAALLAGCSGRGVGGTADDSATQTTVETTARTETQTETDTPTETDTQTDTQTATASGDEYDDGYGDSYGGGSDTPTETDTSTETGTQATTVQVVVDNVSASAWEFVGDSGVGDGGENPTITLEPGTRYVVENRGWSAHPFAFLADDGTSLLTQEDGGTFADDADVDWRDDGDEFAFTLTPELADAVDRYVCTIHARMQGDVTTA